MDQAKVMEVLRQVEWALTANEEFCPCCYWLKRAGHKDDCKLDALLSEGEEERVRAEEPTITVWILGPLEGLRAWLFGVLFQLGAALVGYDFELVIDDGAGNVEKLRQDKH